MDKGDKIFWVVEGTLIILGLFILFVLPSIKSTHNHLEGNVPSATSAGYYNFSSDEITVFRKNNTIGYFLTLRHEKCHRAQNYQGRLSVGSKAIFWDELECNIKRWVGIYDYMKWRKK